MQQHSKRIGLTGSRVQCVTGSGRM